MSDQTRYAFGYVRVSTDKQEELSPSSQEKLLREYAAKNNIVVLKTFFELGVSGRKADKRPQFQQMIAEAKSPEHPADVILVWKYSRFARNQEESIVYKSMLKKKHNVEVVSISEPLIDGPFGSLIERIIEWMDEYYSIRLSGEVTRGMKEKALQSGYQIKPPLGYKAVGNGKPFVINEEEYKMVEFIFERFDFHKDDYTRIARSLNEMGYRTRQGKAFESRTVMHILQNPFYYGLVVWKDVSFMGSHEVRISKERYDSRMEQIQKQYKPYKRRNISSCRHWLAGLLKCGYCGASLSFNGSNNRCVGFQCYQYSKGRHNESCFISEQKVTAAIEKYFEQLLEGMDFEYTYRAPESEEQLSEYDNLTAKLEKLENREYRIRLAYENGVDTLEEYKQNKERLQKDREFLEEQIASLQDPQPDTMPTKEDVLLHIQTVYDVIRNPNVDYETKGTFMRSLVEDIVYDKKNNRLIFHLYTS